MEGLSQRCAQGVGQLGEGVAEREARREGPKASERSADWEGAKASNIKVEALRRGSKPLVLAGATDLQRGGDEIFS